MAYSLGDILASTASLQPKQPFRVKSARSRNRAAAWSYDLAQWRDYRLAMVKSPQERQQLEEEYTRRAQAGPDFTGYHAKSDYSEPHQHDLTKGGKQAILRAFDEVRAWLFRNSRKPRGQAVSRVYREVLQVLLSFAVKYGAAYPSHATIARLACCSERTVVNALAWLRLWGFLTWARRLKRIPGRLGVTVRQTSNAYRLVLSGLAAIGANVFARSATGFASQRADRNHYNPSPLTALVPRLLEPEGRATIGVR